MSAVGKKFEEMTFEASEKGTLNFPADLKGKKTLFYFYPKDDTPGCTVQACSYRDNIDSFTSKGIQVFGVSSDDMGSHKAFSEKFTLNFPLIVDSEKKLAAFFGVTGRDTFLVDGEATVVHEWKNVSPDTTVSETLAAASELS